MKVKTKLEKKKKKKDLYNKIRITEICTYLKFVSKFHLQG